MGRAARDAGAGWRQASRLALSRVEVIALFPVLVLGAHALGNGALVLAAAMVLPSLLVLLALGDRRWPARTRKAPTGPAGLTADRATMLAMLDRISAMPGMETACFLLQVDDWDRIERRLGVETARDLHDECLGRLRAALRADDLVAVLGPARFGIVLHPIGAARLGIRDAIADRLRAGLGAAIAVGGATLRLTACVGHAALDGDGARAEPTLAGAALALDEAQAAGPGSVRAHVAGARGRRRSLSQLAEEVPEALASGAIRPWFQPQIDARTTEVAGFEALARWQHPTLGLLTPARFLDAIDHAGRMEEFGTIIRRQALDALCAWDRAGQAGLTVSVNAGATDLRSPVFAELVAWDLDAAGIAPARLIVEVLESVAADASDDAVLATLSALRGQGVGLDLDDFGVGQASLLSIRRFGVRCIKIDRSFVLGIDRDPGQQAMVGGIVSLARRMGVEALAEGVETPAEGAALCDLGCTYVQGFGIGRPMPLGDTFGWLRARSVPARPRVGTAARVPSTEGRNP